MLEHSSTPTVLPGSDVRVVFGAGTLNHIGEIARAQGGTRILLVTDGITETRDANGEFFEEDRLEAAILKGADPDAILEAAEAFAGSPTAEDDRTVLEIVYTGEK